MGLNVSEDFAESYCLIFGLGFFAGRKSMTADSHFLGLVVITEF